ncbi:MAG TPA: hypothetical protein VFZ59_07660 [Verrucomicrobiae bacterium]|nr:hypothetical protein [Verrucomicrobiae bacterium]
MNGKTKSLAGIWEKSGNEPRHFFFWLMLLSPVVYVMALLMVGFAGNPPPFSKWFALAGLVGFFIGVPAFVLSWIPPLRQWFTRLLRHKLLVFAGLVTLIALFYAVENWRGRTAWNHFRREWEARGVEFALDKIVPPPIPEAENMYEAEPWRGFHFIRSGGILFENTNIQSEVWFDITGPKRREAPEGTDLFLARQVKLEEWQNFYRGTNNQFTSAGGGLTNYFPVAAAPQTPAQDVLLALSKFEDRLNQIRTAAQRPKARFWVNYEDGFGALIPHLAKFKSIATYLRLRSTALLADGQTDAAFDDLMLAFRLDKALQDEPILISHLVRIAVLQVNLSTLWEGLASHRWTDAQLAAFEAELAGIDVLAEYQNGMNGERYFSMWCVDFLYRTGDLNSIGGSAEPGNYSLGDQLIAANNKATFHLIPRGWFDQNKVSLGKMHVDYIRPMVDVEKQLVPPANLRRTSAAMSSYRPTPYNLFAGLLLPALEGASKKSAVAQTYVNFARIACALERYRLANGNYPEALDVLAPKFISKLPHDVINGQPLKYRRNADGSFVLYSVGWNETDDGGQVVRLTNKNGKEGGVDQDKGDWVWQLPKR